MRTNLTDEQKERLMTRRNEVVGRLHVLDDPCPGCMKPVTIHDAEFHHVPWRQSDAYTFETDLLLLDTCNGVLAHHACHMKEGWDFQVRAALLIWHRVGTGQLRRFKAELEKECVAAPPWPAFMQAVMETMAGRSSQQRCPLCRGYHLHEYRNPPRQVGAPVDEGGPLRAAVLCWDCLCVLPAGTRLDGEETQASRGMQPSCAATQSDHAHAGGLRREQATGAR